MNQTVKQIKSLLKQMEKDSKYHLGETLSVSKRKGCFQYYCLEANSKKRVYIKKENHQHAAKLAQRDYALALTEKLNKALNVLQSFENTTIEKLESEVFYSFPEYKKELLVRYYLPAKEFADYWENKEYVKSVTSFNSPLFTTMKKDKVRSKSEVIIANQLFMAKIPYHYEEKLFLPSFGNIYPDFTILNKRTRQIIIWEHFGLMNNPEYVEKTISKINLLQTNGYFQGKQVIFSFETKDNPLDPQIVMDIINEYLI